MYWHAPQAFDNKHLDLMKQHSTLAWWLWLIDAWHYTKRQAERGWTPHL